MQGADDPMDMKEEDGASSIVATKVEAKSSGSGSNEDVQHRQRTEAKRKSEAGAVSSSSSNHIVFTPLYGIEDCGWTDNFDVDMLEPLKKVAPEVSAVVISFGDLKHMGALPYAFSHLGLDAPVFATIPTAQMGRAVLEDAYESVRNRSAVDRAMFDLEFVRYAISRIVQGGVNYLEKKMLRVRYEKPLSFTPFRAGRLLGGAVWKIQSEADKIIYAVDYNDLPDTHLGKSVLGYDKGDEDVDFYRNALVKSTLLITSATNAKMEYNEHTNLKRRLRDFKNDVVTTLQRGGNVLVPIDAGGRVLEILLVLHRLWAQQQLQFELCLAHRRADMTMDFARRSLEFMREGIRDNFNESRRNAFDIAYREDGKGGLLRVLNNVEDVQMFLQRDIQSRLFAHSQRKIVLATSESLESGLARTIFKSWAGDRRNLVCFTSRAFEAETTLARALQRSKGVSSELVKFGTYATINLEGAKLAAYREERARLDALIEHMKERRRKEEEEDEDEEDDFDEDGAIDAREDAMEEEDDDEDEDDDVDSEDDVDWRTIFDKQIVAGREGKEKHVMFPFRPRRVQWDDYGIKGARDLLSEAKTDAAAADSSTNMFVPAAIVRPKAMSAKDIADAKAARVRQSDDAVPTTSVLMASSLYAHCRVATHELEGRSDGTAMKEVVRNLAPRNVVFIHGNREEREVMQRFVESELSARFGTRCWGASTEVPVRVSAGSCLVKVAIRKDVLDKLTAFPVGRNQDETNEYTVSNIFGKIETIEVSEDPPTVITDAPTVANSRPKLALVPRAIDVSRVSRGVPMRRSFFFRRQPLKLGGLFKVLQKRTKSKKIRIRDGKIYVNNTVRVYRDANTGEYRIEGVVGDDYYAVRDVIYSQYIVL